MDGIEPISEAGKASSMSINDGAEHGRSLRLYDFMPRESWGWNNFPRQLTLSTQVRNLSPSLESATQYPLNANCLRTN